MIHIASRQLDIQRRRRLRGAMHLIQTLETLRPHWKLEDLDTDTFERLAERWDQVEITEDDLETLRKCPGLPLTLPGLLTNLAQHVEDAWATLLEIGASDHGELQRGIPSITNFVIPGQL